MKKTIGILILLLTVCASAWSQIPKMEVFELNAQATLVVTGKVSLLEGKTFTVAIDQVVAGNYGEKTIVVERFHPTKTAKRWGKYVVGEELMLWLHEVEGAWHIVGAGGEGEKLVFNGEVYLDSRGGGLKNSFGNHAPYPQLSIYAEKVKAEEFIAAVKDTKDAFKLEVEDGKNPEGLPFQKRFAVKNLDDKQMDELRSKGWMQDNILSNGEKHLR